MSQKAEAAAATSEPLLTPLLRHDNILGDVGAEEKEHKKTVQNKQFC